MALNVLSVLNALFSMHWHTDLKHFVKYTVKYFNLSRSSNIFSEKTDIRSSAREFTGLCVEQGNWCG